MDVELNEKKYSLAFLVLVPFLASIALPGLVAKQVSKSGTTAATQAETAPAQETHFDAVVLRRSAENVQEIGAMGLPGGRLEMQNRPLGELIGYAYPMRFINAPGWLDERYTFRAKAPDGATRQEIAAMLKQFLADRLKLVSHQETRPTPIYALTTVRKDEKPGRWLVPRTSSCQPNEMVKVQAFAPASAPVELRCGEDRVSPWSVLAAAISMPGFGRILTSLVIVGAPVIDETGLQGTFDITLRYSTKERTAPIDAEWPSLFDALEDQLGLTLVSKQEQRPVLVIDRIERPSVD